MANFEILPNPTTYCEDIIQNINSIPRFYHRIQFYIYINFYLMSCSVNNRSTIYFHVGSSASFLYNFPNIILKHIYLGYTLFCLHDITRESARNYTKHTKCIHICYFYLTDSMIHFMVLII